MWLAVPRRSERITHIRQIANAMVLDYRRVSQTRRRAQVNANRLATAVPSRTNVEGSGMGSDENAMESINTIG